SRHRAAPTRSAPRQTKRHSCGLLDSTDRRGRGGDRLLEPAEARTTTADRQSRDPAGKEEDDQDEQRAEQEERLRDRRPEQTRQVLDGRRAADSRERLLVEVCVEHTADDGAPAR